MEVKYVPTSDAKNLISPATGVETRPSPHKQLIEAICNDVLPDMVTLFNSKKMSFILDRDQFEKIIDDKVELANNSLQLLSVEEQHRYRAKIDQAYTETIDRLNGIPR